MSQLTILKSVLENPPVSDELLQYYLDNAGEIICDLRNSDIVESKYFNVQIAIAVELFNKRGAEGEVSHGENGISRGYEKSDISPSLLSRITPMVKTPYSVQRVIE